MLGHHNEWQSADLAGALALMTLRPMGLSKARSATVRNIKAPWAIQICRGPFRGSLMPVASALLSDEVDRGPDGE